MIVSQQIITFSSEDGAQQFAAAANSQQVTRVLVRPLRSNTHVAYVGLSTVSNDGSGAGVIQELAAPPASTDPAAITVPTDAFDHADQSGDNTIDPTQFWADGTDGEKLLVTYFQR